MRIDNEDHICLQGRVYYAFFEPDERTNFEQLTTKIKEIKAPQ